jgi:hypothetical protein
VPLLLRVPLLFPIVPILPPRVLPLFELPPREFMLPIVPPVLPLVVPGLLPMLLPFVVPPMLSLPIVVELVVLVVPVVPVVPVVELPVVIVLLVLFVVPVLLMLSPPPQADQNITITTKVRRAKIRRI